MERGSQKGRGFGRRGPGAVLALLARQSGAAGSAARAARAPATGRSTGHDPPWSLDSCPPWTLHRTLPPTGLDTTTDSTSQLRTLLPPPPWALDALPPPPPGAQTLSPPQALVRDPLHPSARHCLLPVPFSLPLLPPRLSPACVGAQPVSPTPCCSAPAVRAPIPRLLARMPLPGGLWWLLCCRRGFTLLHRDYGDGELSGDGDEDEDEETFELRTPSPAGGGRVSPGGFGALSQSLSLPPAITPAPTPDSNQMPRSWRTGDGRERFLPGGQKPPGAQGATLLGCACGPRAARWALSTCWGP